METIKRKILSYEELMRWEMPFGKHRGLKLSEIPESYLEWASTNIEGNVGRRINEYLAAAGIADYDHR